MKIDLLYDAFMAPLETFAGLSACRGRLLPRARGAVLEAGPGTGINSAGYRQEKLESITLLSPEAEPGKNLMKRYHRIGVPVSYVPGDVQSLPFGDRTFDTVVATLLFCSVRDPVSGLKELRRVLKPGGEYLFLEHVRPKRNSYARLADIATPIWRKIAGGCHLNRETEAAILEAGFRIDHTCDYAKGVFVGGVAHL